MKLQSPGKWLWLLLLLLVLALTAGAGWAIANHLLDQIPRTYPEDVSTIPPGSDSALVEGVPSLLAPDPDQSLPLNDEDLLNILLVGYDSWTDLHRSDAMILCSINPETKEVALISFLRDMFVQIPGGYRDNRLNVAYTLGGFPLLNDTLSQNFGVTIDGNVALDFDGFRAIIDHLGGVDLELTQAEADYLNVYDDASLGTWAVEGMNHMNGAQALQYTRIRKRDSDFSRTERQRDLLEEVYRSVRELSLPELLDLIEAALPYVTTDMTNGEIISTAARLFPLLSDLELTSHAVPGEGAYENASVEGKSVLLPDLEAAREQLANEYLPLS